MALKKRSTASMPDWIRHLLLAYLCAALLEFICLPRELKNLATTDGVAQMSMTRLLLVTAALTLILWLLSLWKDIKKPERWLMVLAFFGFSGVALYHNFAWGFFGFCCLIAVCLIVYAIFGYRCGLQLSGQEKKPHWIFPVAVGVLAVIFTVVISVWTVNRVRTFFSPDYDLGIFSQMFYNMKETGLPMTTVERDGLLSHFAVHVSPIYYLMLPFYWLFPSPITLQILQAVVLASAVIPMWLIGKQRGLSGIQRVFVCVLLLAIPTTGGGTGYDLHENCFLLPLILWLMYAFDRRSILLTLLFAVLTLAVKEDAAVYVAVAAIYVIVRTVVNYDKKHLKDMFLGFAALAMSLTWFLLVTDYLANQGDGVMTSRYNNFIYDGSGSLFSVVKAVVLCPMKMLFESVEPEKMEYVLFTLVPLVALPLITRKYQRYLLLIPYILLNLMSDYQYQHDIFFQYNFGSSAFLLYLTAINLADIRWKLPRFLASVAAVAVSVSMFCSLIVPEVKDVTKLYRENEAYYQRIRQTLEEIPEDASVTAHTFYVVPLSDRSVLYDIRYCSRENLLSTEYVILKKSSTSDFRNYAVGGKNGYENLVALLEENGYENIKTQGSLVIYHKP